MKVTESTRYIIVVCSFCNQLRELQQSESILGTSSHCYTRCGIVLSYMAKKCVKLNNVARVEWQSCMFGAPEGPQ